MTKKQPTQRDLLVQLSTDMGWVKTVLENHLAHHRKWIYMLGAAILSGGAGLLLFAIKALWELKVKG